ncbi:metallophosphoesterase family protein [Clostridium hydrogenum]|uniref:metallophosphoesterase family protein n=1 Tax=Clostridium hydrogenum TaxID=2855764 RepID=UPI001F35FA50|nr:metallophosphoesterase [Clostridium hydrogenum]
MYEEQLQLLEERKKYLNPKNYNIVFMGDSWVEQNGHTSIQIFKNAMEEAKKYNPLLILHGGDIVFSGSEKDNFQFFIDTKNSAAPNLPLFTAIGNHEMNIQLTGDAAVANFVEMIGPLHFTLNIPRYDLTLIALDSLYHHVYHDYGLTKEELEYLRENLRGRYQNTLVGMHVPPATDEWIPEPGDDSFFTKGSQAFFREVKEKIVAALVSHVHTFATTKYKGTRLYLSGGGGAALVKKSIFHILVINITNYSSGSRLCFSVVPVGEESPV